MTTTNENIRQLLEMLDHPEAYSEQQMLDIILRNEDTRQTYRQMVEAKRSSRHRKTDYPIDVDAAGMRLNQKLQPKKHGYNWTKVAALFIGVLLVSGIAFATIFSLTPAFSPKSERNEYELASDTVRHSTRLSHQRATVEEAAPVVYDNVPLEQMVLEIAAHYDAEVTFQSDEARQLRFHFVWNPQQGLEQVVSDLNQFECLTVTLNDNQITIE